MHEYVKYAKNIIMIQDYSSRHEQRGVFSTPKIVVGLLAFIVIIAGIYVLMARYGILFRQTQPALFPLDYTRLEGLASKHPQKERILSSIRKFDDELHDEDTKNDAEAYIGIGFELRQLGDESAAIEAYRAGLAVDGTHVRGWGNLAVSYKETGQYERAEEAYKKVIEFNPGDVEAYINLADLYRYRLPDKEGKIVEVMQDGLAHLPEHPDFLAYLAVYYRDKGDKAKAIEYFERRLRVPGLEPDIAKAIAEELNKLRQ